MKTFHLRNISLLLFFPILLQGQVLTLDELKDNFKDPGAEWRGKPFWAWNGDLEKEEPLKPSGLIGPVILSATRTLKLMEKP